uniref:Lipid-binding serum glycoprotein C-terminal domain-containing protein n=1 Tax=Plectus sambesii TaxID=2011161 RepID=A0A914USA4_9BILA
MAGLVESLLVAQTLLSNVSLSSSNSTLPALRARLTPRGIDYASVLSHQILQDEIHNITFPSITAEITDGPGHGVVTVHQMSIEKFEAPVFKYQLAPPHGITWKSTGGSVLIKGDWSAWYLVLFKIYVNGQVRVWAENIDIFLNASVYATKNGLPQLKVLDCAANVGSLSIDITGGVIPWIVNLFHTSIAASIRAEIHDEVCIAARGVLLNNANTALRSLPTHVPLQGGFCLDYALTSDPVSTQDYVQGESYAAISWQEDNSTAILPNPLPEPVVPLGRQRMLYFWASDFIANTFLRTAHLHDFLEFVVDKSFGGRVASFLRTTCDFICIGTAIPQLGKKYPNHTVDVVLKTIAAPFINVHAGNALLNASLSADVYISPYNTTQELVIEACVDLSGNLTVSMARRLVKGALQITNFTLTIKNSTIGTVDKQAVHLIEVLLRPILQMLATAVLDKGIELPTVENITLVRPQIVMLERAIRIETDLVYKQHYHRKLVAAKRNRRLGEKP